MSPHALPFDANSAPEVRTDDPVLTYLQHHMPDWPFDPDIDPDYVDELHEDFANIDLLEQVKAFRWYYGNEPTERMKNVRIGLRRWLTNAWTRR